jgi:VRR-NUC domain
MDVGEYKTAVKKPRETPERDLQIAVAEWLKLCWPQVVGAKVLWTASASGAHTPDMVTKKGKRFSLEAVMLKKMGVNPGWPDLQFAWKNREGFMCCGAIELKSPTGSLRNDQEIFRDNWIDKGGRWALCRTQHDVENSLIYWGLNPPFRAPLALKEAARQVKNEMALEAFRPLPITSPLSIPATS